MDEKLKRPTHIEVFLRQVKCIAFDRNITSNDQANNWNSFHSNYLTTHIFNVINEAYHDNPE